MNKTFIVTGAAGFLGNNIVRKLVESGEKDVRALVLEGDNTRSLENVGCAVYYGDVTKKQSLDEIFDVPAGNRLYVIHCAAVVYIKSGKNPKVREVNVGGTRNVMEKALEKYRPLLAAKK